MARKDSSPHSAKSLSIITEYDRLQSMLLSKNTPMSLVSIFTFISRLLEQYVMLLKKESEEGHLVTRSLNFATNSRNVIKTLSNEMKLANEAINTIGTHTYIHTYIHAYILLYTYIYTHIHTYILIRMYSMQTYSTIYINTYR